MEYDFSEPRKQSAAGIVVMFVNSLQKIIRALALPIVFIIIKSRGLDNLTLIIITGLLLLSIILALFAYLSYQKFTFFLDQEKQEFIINKGVFNRTILTIQLNKIQQVNISQSLIQRIIGVYSLDIDTAGSEKKEASIKAIDHQTATLLKQRLLSKQVDDRAASNSVEPQVSTAQHTSPPLLKLNTTTLFKVGITSNYGASFILLSGFAFGAWQLFKNYTDAFEIERAQIGQELVKGFTLFSICILLIFALFVILSTNIIRTFVKYFNFEIVRQKHTLAVSSGLFTRKNTLLTPEKVQLSAYSQNYFQKRFDLLNLKIKQASFNDASKEDSKKSDLEIPGCDEQERNEILKMIFGQLPKIGTELAPNYRFIFLQSMIWIVFPIFLFLLSAYIHPPLFHYFLLIIPHAILVATMLYFEFKRHRLYVDGNFIIKRSGIWDVEHEIIEPYKIQAITAKQYFWHKKADVGHLILHTAAGIIHFRYGNYAQIQNLVNYWMFKVESSKKDWM
jgi:putative membrane protein